MKAEFTQRLFIGIPAGRAIQPILKDIQSSIKHNPCKIQWVPSENIHMTLAFLGNVSFGEIKKLTQTFEDGLDLTHFKVSIEKTGVFPSIHQPNILWLGVGKSRQKMMTLQKQVGKVANPFKQNGNIENFIPHITIGRITRTFMKIDVLPFLEYVYSPRELNVNSLALYGSQLFPLGAKYKVLSTFPLN